MTETTASQNGGEGTLASTFRGLCFGVGTVCIIAAGLLWHLADTRIATAEAGYNNSYIELHKQLLNMRNGAAVLALVSFLIAVVLNR